MQAKKVPRLVKDCDLVPSAFFFPRSQPDDLVPLCKYLSLH